MLTEQCKVDFTCSRPHYSDMDTLAQRFEWALGRAGYKSVEPLVPHVGVTRQALYQWKKGEVKELKAEHAIKLADALGVNVKWLVFGYGRPDAPLPDQLDPAVVEFVIRSLAALSKFTIDKRMSTSDKVAFVLDIHRRTRGSFMDFVDEEVQASAIDIILRPTQKT